MSKKNKYNNITSGLIVVGLPALASIIVATAIHWDLNHKHDEEGTIVYKENYELAIDLDGDKQPDRMLRLSDWRLESKTFYNYAKVGDKISYVNELDNTIIDDGPENLEIQEVNGKTFSQICEWNELNKRVKMKSR